MAPSRRCSFAAAAIGVVASVVQFLGLIRWPFLVPYLARESERPDISPARQEAIDIVFQSFNRYLGVAVGEHLGFLFTGAWTALVGTAILQSSNVNGWIGVAGIVIGIALALVLPRVRRALRAQGMETRGCGHALRLRPLVALVDRHGHRTAGVTEPRRNRPRFRRPSQGTLKNARGFMPGIGGVTVPP